MNSRAEDWAPLPDPMPMNRVLLKLEQRLLQLFRGTVSLGDLLRDALVNEACAWVDQNPLQAFLFTRMKGGHAMTPRHGINVMLTARAWARTSHKLGPKLELFSRACLIHDLGHWRPDDLTMVLGAFTHEQARALRRHAVIEDEAIAELDPQQREWIEQHHEQPDGRGYPKGMRNPHPLAQMIRIVDCFEGLTSMRPFRKDYSYCEALSLMSRWAGFKYDAGLFKSFRNFLGAFPGGTYVRLADGALGVTIHGTALGLWCLVLTDGNGHPLAEPGHRTVEEAEIRGEAFHFQELALPEPWRSLRPDLLGLPRSLDEAHHPPLD